MDLMVCQLQRYYSYVLTNLDLVIPIPYCFNVRKYSYSTRVELHPNYFVHKF